MKIKRILRFIQTSSFSKIDGSKKEYPKQEDNIRVGIIKEETKQSNYVENAVLKQLNIYTEELQKISK